MRDKTDYERMIRNYKENNLFMSNTDIAYELILKDILSGILKMGERINQENLAVLYDMSRTPIREALFRLSEEGFVEHSENTGYNVCDFQIRDYIDFWEFRLVFEPQIAFLAARSITQTKLRQVEENLKQYIAACEQGNVNKALHLDVQFHTLLAEACGNKYLKEVAEKYQKKRNFYTRFFSGEEHFFAIRNKHQAIYDALIHSDEEAAMKQMKSHLSFYMKNL